jgi:hypothetical protein
MKIRYRYSVLRIHILSQIWSRSRNILKSRFRIRIRKKSFRIRNPAGTVLNEYVINGKNCLATILGFYVADPDPELVPFWPRNPGFVRKQDPGPGSGSGVGINIFPRANKTICWGENTYGNVHVPWHLRFRYDWLIMCSFFKITVSEGTKYDNAYISVADRDPVSFWPRDSGSGMGKKSGSGSGSGINCRIIFPTNTNHCFGLT